MALSKYAAKVKKRKGSGPAVTRLTQENLLDMIAEQMERTWARIGNAVKTACSVRQAIGVFCNPRKSLLPLLPERIRVEVTPLQFVSFISHGHVTLEFDFTADNARTLGLVALRLLRKQTVDLVLTSVPVGGRAPAVVTVSPDIAIKNFGRLQSLYPEFFSFFKVQANRVYGLQHLPLEKEWAREHPVQIQARRNMYTRCKRFRKTPRVRRLEKARSRNRSGTVGGVMDMLDKRFYAGGSTSLPRNTCVEPTSG